MTAKPLLLLLPVLAFLSACAELVTVTPRLEGGEGDRKVQVRSRVTAVTVLAYSPDGRQIASGGTSPTVRIWDLAAARGLRPLELAAPFGVMDLAYSPDGRLLAASGRTTLVGGDITRLWDRGSGREVGAPAGPVGNRLAFSSDGRHLLGSEFDPGSLLGGLGTFHAKQLALPGGEVLRTFRGHSVGDMAPDGRHALLLAERRDGLALVDLNSGREVWRTGGHRVDAAAFLPDGRQFLAARSHYEGLGGGKAAVSVALHEAASGRELRELLRYEVHDHLISRELRRLRTLVVAPDGQRFLTADAHGDYRLWDMASGRLLHELKRPDEKILMAMSPAHAAFSPDGRLVAITSAASVRLYDVASGGERAALIAFDDGEWLVTTPSGYYNASEKGDEYLEVSVGGRPFSVAQLRESFFRPELVRLALAGGTLGQYRQVADVKPPPQVAIVDTPAKVDAQELGLSLRLTDQGGGIGDLRVYRNGTAVVQENAGRLAGRTAADGRRQLRFDIRLEPGRNVLRVIAFNADNSMQSQDAVFEVQASVAARPPALHALVVGIKDFANPRLALRYPVADAELFATTLEQHGRGLYREIHVRRLFTAPETTSQAIVAALRQARLQVQPEDLFVFYVASHGTVDDGQYRLITSNVGSTASARLRDDALGQDTLKELIANIPAGKKLVVLDTCSAGQLGDALQVAILTRGMSDDTAMKVLSRAVGSTVLSAASSVQEALEGYRGHGLFTYVIAAGLAGAADANRDGFVKTLELADYVDSQVPDLAESVFKHKQYPIVSPSGQGFPLVKVR